MTNEIRRFIAFSLIFHAGIFLFFSLHTRNASFIVLPVELMFTNPPSAAPDAADAPATHAPLTTPREKDVIVPKKEKQETRKKVKKETVQDAKKAPQETAPAQAPAGSEAPSMPSSPLSVDAARFPFTYYTNQVVKKIGRNWQWSTEFGDLKTVVRFRILRSGEILSVDVDKSSGDRVFDDQAVRAVKLSSPFPPLPDGYEGDDLGVYFEFRYHE